MKIVIDFNPETQEVVSVTVGNTEKKLPAVKKVKKEKEIDETVTATLEGNKLIISPKLAVLLSVEEGSKLIIRYKQDGEFIEPFLGPPAVFGEEEGNKLTKSLSISFRGDQNAALARFGATFEVEDMQDGSVKLLSLNKVKDNRPVVTLEALTPIASIGDDLILTKTNFTIQ